MENDDGTDVTLGMIYKAMQELKSADVYTPKPQPPISDVEPWQAADIDRLKVVPCKPSVDAPDRIWFTGQPDPTNYDPTDPKSDPRRILEDCGVEFGREMTTTEVRARQQDHFRHIGEFTDKIVEELRTAVESGMPDYKRYDWAKCGSSTLTVDDDPDWLTDEQVDDIANLIDGIAAMSRGECTLDELCTWVSEEFGALWTKFDGATPKTPERKAAETESATMATALGKLR